MRTLWVIGPVFVGLVGAYRLLSATGSRRAQVGVLVAYVVVPLATVSISSGSIAGLVGYAAAPWMLGALLRAGGAAPYRSMRGSLPELMRTAVVLGAVAGIAAGFEPSAALLPALIATGLVLGGVLAGRPGGSARTVGVIALAAPVAAVVCLPQVFDFVADGWSWAPFADGRNGAADTISLLDLSPVLCGPRRASAACPGC